MERYVVLNNEGDIVYHTNNLDDAKEFVEDISKEEIFADEKPFEIYSLEEI